MKVLLITVRSDTGGGPKHVFDLARSIKNKYQKTQITIASPLNEPYGKLFEELAEKHFEIPHRKFSLLKYLFLLVYCKDQNIDIVHSHGRGAGYYSRLLGLFGIKVVHTFHGAHAEKTTVGKVKVTIDRILKMLTDKLINVSHDEFKTALSIGITDKAKAAIVPNGIDHKKIKKEFDLYNKDESRISLNLPLNSKIWGTLSRLTYQKGLDLFLNFDLPEDIYFAIAGDGEEKEALLKSLPTEKKKQILFLGNIKDPVKLLSALDGYFSSARWEGLPLSVLEAMSCHLPCVLSRVDGHQELEAGAILYNLKDKEALKTKLLNSDLSSLGKSGGKMIENDYNLELMAERTFEVYCHL